MCIFAAPVKNVAATKILVAPLEGGCQLTCYATTVEANSPNAMILPVPLPDPSAAEQVSLVNLQSVDFLFADLDKAFPVAKRDPNSRLKSAPKARAMKMDYLEVQRCGSFKVSIAPTLLDLKRIDRTQLPLASEVEALLQDEYGSDFGFVVCMFQKGEPMHPMGYVAPVVDDTLFVPTKHEHGDSGDKAFWDHELFSFGCGGKCEGCDDAGQTPEETMKGRPGPGMIWGPGASVPELKAVKELQALLPSKLSSLTLRRRTICGDFENKDLYFVPGAPAGMCALM